MTDIEQLREHVARFIGDVKPATDGLLEQLARSVADIRDHDHPKHEDVYCMNLTSWSGERTAPVLRRLIDAEAEIKRLRADRAEALADAAEVAVRAARACSDSETGQYAASIAAGIGKELRRMARRAGSEKDTPTGESTHAQRPASAVAAFLAAAQNGRATTGGHARD